MHRLAQSGSLLVGAAVLVAFTTFTRADDSPLLVAATSPTECSGVSPEAAPAASGAGGLSGSFVRPAYLQLVNPADDAREHAGMSTTQPAPPSPDSHPLQSHERLRSYELPPVNVVGQSPSGLKEEERVGANEQPRWTAERRFPGTRIYVQPEGTVEFEFWLRPTIPRHGQSEFRSLAELEFGLPGRFQLDLYLRSESQSGSKADIGQSVELRYAFADWNKIWGNPTLYLEWSRLDNEADSIEAKLLLGGEIAPRWHWGLNLSDELLTGGARDNEIEITGGVSYTLADSLFSVGAETECGIVDHQHHRGTYDDNFFYVGPSFQYRPTEQIHIDFAPLVGIGHENPAAQIYLVFGYEF